MSLKLVQASAQISSSSKTDSSFSPSMSTHRMKAVSAALMDGGSGEGGRVGGEGVPGEVGELVVDDHRRRRQPRSAQPHRTDRPHVPVVPRQQHLGGVEELTLEGTLKLAGWLVASTSEFSEFLLSNDKKTFQRNHPSPEWRHRRRRRRRVSSDAATVASSAA